MFYAPHLLCKNWEGGKVKKKDFFDETQKSIFVNRFLESFLGWTLWWWTRLKDQESWECWLSTWWSISTLTTSGLPRSSSQRSSTSWMSSWTCISWTPSLVNIKWLRDKERLKYIFLKMESLEPMVLRWQPWWMMILRRGLIPWQESFLVSQSALSRSLDLEEVWCRETLFVFYQSTSWMRSES